MQDFSNLAGSVGIFLQRVLLYLHPDTGSVRQKHVAPLYRDGFIDDFGIWRLEDAGFMEDIIWYCSVQLYLGWSINGAPHEVGENTDKGRFGEGGNLLAVGYAASQGDIGTDVANIREELLKLLDVVLSFPRANRNIHVGSYIS